MFNILISLILLPLIGSLIICLLDYNNIKAIRTVALYTTTITFFISLLLLVFFDKSNFGFQFLTSINWLNAINVNFVLGIDGIALFFILLTTFLFFYSVHMYYFNHTYPGNYIIIMHLYKGNN